MTLTSFRFTCYYWSYY